MRLVKLAVLVAFAAVPVVAAAGVGSATLPPTDTEAPATSVPAGSEPAPAGAPSSAPGDGTPWERIVPGGDCACADGSEFAFWVRPADPAKVVLFLEGGGACFDATSCAFTEEDSTLYDWNVSDDDDPALQAGIFDFTRADNPFADYTFVYVPYCTGDVHLGDITREYSPELSVEHVGFVNGTAALTYLASNYPDAEQVVVVGESAGSIASPVYAGLVGDELPDAQVTVFADGSGAYPDDPNLNAGIGALWGSFDNMPDWEVNEGLTPQDWGIPRFVIQAGLHNPDIVIGRFDYAYDAVQTAFMNVTGADASDLAASIAGNEETAEAAGVVVHSFTAPGEEHTLVRKDTFYEMELDGVTLVDWVGDLIGGDDVADVRCTECGGTATATTG